MATRKLKSGQKVTVGDEISFYQNKVVRTGIVHFVGETFVSVYPCNVEVLGIENAPMRDIEHNVELGDIL